MGANKIKEQTSGPAAEAGYGSVWVKDDAPNVLQFTDDTGTVWTVSNALGRSTGLGAAPSTFTFKVLDGGAGVGDILYFSGQNTSDAWVWAEVVRVP